MVVLLASRLAPAVRGGMAAAREQRLQRQRLRDMLVGLLHTAGACWACWHLGAWHAVRVGLAALHGCRWARPRSRGGWVGGCRASMGRHENACTTSLGVTFVVGSLGVLQCSCAGCNVSYVRCHGLNSKHVFQRSLCPACHATAPPQGRPQEPRRPPARLNLQRHTKPTKPLHRQPGRPGPFAAGLQQHHSRTASPAAARARPFPAVQAHMEAGSAGWAAARQCAASDKRPGTATAVRHLQRGTAAAGVPAARVGAVHAFMPCAAGEGGAVLCYVRGTAPHQDCCRTCFLYMYIHSTAC